MGAALTELMITVAGKSRLLLVAHNNQNAATHFNYVYGHSQVLKILRWLGCGFLQAF